MFHKQAFISPAVSALTFQELMVLMALVASVAGLKTTVAKLISAVISRRDSWHAHVFCVAWNCMFDC